MDKRIPGGEHRKRNQAGITELLAALIDADQETDGGHGDILAEADVHALKDVIELVFPDGDVFSIKVTKLRGHP